MEILVVLLAVQEQEVGADVDGTMTCALPAAPMTTRPSPDSSRSASRMGIRLTP